MRGLGILVRVIGWLLTPLVAWAASFYSAWALLHIEDRFADPRHAMYAALIAALLAGVVALLGWMQLLKRSPRLRHTLHVDREGLPLLDEVEPSSEEVAASKDRE